MAYFIFKLFGLICVGLMIWYGSILIKEWIEHGKNNG